MVVSDALHRSRIEHRESDRLRAQAAADLRRIQEAARRIQRMTEIYQERLEGKRRV